MVFWPWSVPSQGRSVWGDSLEWLTSKKGLGYGREGLTTFCFFFCWFCLILFVQPANTLGRGDLEFRSTRTSPLSLIEKAMVAGDPKAHECHEYHFKAFPRSQFPLPVSLRSKYWSPGRLLADGQRWKKIKFFRVVNQWRFELWISWNLKVKVVKVVLLFCIVSCLFCIKLRKSQLSQRMEVNLATRFSSR